MLRPFLSPSGVASCEFSAIRPRVHFFCRLDTVESGARTSLPRGKEIFFARKSTLKSHTKTSAPRVTCVPRVTFVPKSRFRDFFQPSTNSELRFAQTSVRRPNSDLYFAQRCAAKVCSFRILSSWENSGLTLYIIRGCKAEFSERGRILRGTQVLSRNQERPRVLSFEKLFLIFIELSRGENSHAGRQHACDEPARTCVRARCAVSLATSEEPGPDSCRPQAHTTIRMLGM